MKKKSADMSCVHCGKANPEKRAVIFGAPTPECPFSFDNGKGMICSECHIAAKPIPMANMRDLDKVMGW